MDGVRPRQAADRRRGDRLRVPRSAAISTSPGRRRTSDELRASVETLRRFGIETTFVDRRPTSGRRSARRSTTAGSSSRRAGCSIPASTSPASSGRPSAPARTSTRASGRRRSGDRPTAGSSSRRRAARSSTKEVVVGTNGYTDGVVPSLRRRIIPIGSYIIATEPLPEELARTVSPRGRAFFDTKNFLYYWHVSEDRRMIFGGRASFLPTNVDHTAAILHKGHARGAPAARRLSRRVRLGRQRRVHRSTACRMSGGRTGSPTRWAAAGPASP